MQTILRHNTYTSLERKIVAKNIELRSPYLAATVLCVKELKVRLICQTYLACVTGGGSDSYFSVFCSLAGSSDHWVVRGSAFEGSDIAFYLYCPERSRNATGGV